MAKKNLLSIIGPGILIAATGVGAGDLATAAFTGAKERAQNNLVNFRACAWDCPYETSYHVGAILYACPNCFMHVPLVRNVNSHR